MLARKMMLRRRLQKARQLGRVWLSKEPDEIRLHQLEALRKQWAEAAHNVPWYRNLVAEGRAPERIETFEQYAEEVPVLSKGDIRDNPDLFRRAEPPDGISRTGGSTSEPLKLGQFRGESIDHTAANQWVGRFANGMREDSRILLAWGHAHRLGTGLAALAKGGLRKAKDRALGYLRVDAYQMGREAVAEYYRRMAAFRPEVVIGYSCALDQFARLSREAGRRADDDCHIRLVVACSEMFPRPDSRETLAEFFGAPVVMEYGGEDGGVSAYELHAESRYRVFWWSHLLEVEEHKDSGPLLITSLTRRYLPLFRYRVGDEIVGASRKGVGILEFDAVAGRSNDFLELQDGTSIHSLSLLRCVRQEAVRNIQLVVEGDGMRLRLAASKLDDTAIERIRGRLGKLHPSLRDIPIDMVEDIETTIAGKRRWIIRRNNASS